MRYIIIFGVTLLLALVIIYYNPYLGVYNDQMTIEYSYSEDGYTWKYELDNNNINIDTVNENKWIIKPNKNGVSNIVYRYLNEDDVMYEIHYELKIKGNKIYWKSGYGIGLLTYPNPY